MAFAQRGSVRSEDQRVVGEERGLPGKGLVKEDLPGGIGEMVLPSDDVSDVHGVVINDAGKIVSRHAIRPDDDKIANPRRIEIHLSMDEVLKQDWPSSHVKSEDGLKAGRFHLSNLLLGEGAAPSVVAGHLSFGELFFSKVFQPLFGAKTLITLSFLRQSTGQFTIDGCALGLTIRTDGSISVRTFVPENSKPSKIFKNPIDGDIVRSL
jgi:hypothetical protein